MNVTRFSLLAAGLLSISAGVFAQAPNVSVIHPSEGMKVPSISQLFVYGAVTPGSMVSVNGSSMSVHAQGGFLIMQPVTPGENVLHFEVRNASGEVTQLDRRFTVAEGFRVSPTKPLTIEPGSVAPQDDMWLMPGDVLSLSFQGSPGGEAWCNIHGLKKHIPLIDAGGRGVYKGTYVLPQGDSADHVNVQAVLKLNGRETDASSKGRVTVEAIRVPRIGQITEDVCAVRTAPDGGYDMFVYKGMRVQLTGKSNGQWRIRLSPTQSGWIKESAVQELPPGSSAPRSLLSNITVTHQPESTLIRIPLEDVLPYRTEHTMDPTLLTLTFYGASNKTDLIRYDPEDPLIQNIRWKQVGPETCQILIQPRFKKWWGYDTRYEGNTFVIEIRKPWPSTSLEGMVIAVDAGHGGTEMGATGPHGTREKDINLQIAKVVADRLEKAGAKPFLIRDKDADVPLYQRHVIAWANQARLFVSVHCNASGFGENPLVTNGFSIYAYHPQSMPLARAIHGYYKKNTLLPDRGLFYADFAVCRMTQMPAVLTEQAYIIVPEQEVLLLDSTFHQSVAKSILQGIKEFLVQP